MSPNRHDPRYFDLGTAPVAGRPAGQWFAELGEYLPRGFIASRCSDLNRLRMEGASPRLAYVYSRVYLQGPDIAPPGHACPVPDYAPAALPDL